MGYALLKSVHLLGIVAWVGGMFFVVHCLRPAAAALEPALRVGLMRDALRRFFGVVIVAIAMVLVTGAWMLATASKVSASTGLGFNMPLDWHVMVTLGIAMMALFGYIRFALFRQVEDAAEAKQWAVAGAALARIRSLVLINLILAVVIVVATRLGAVA